ncbi:hypothetical protein ACHAXH_001845 [Discostella pseudostelligera]
MRVLATSFVILVSVLVSLPHYGSSFAPTNNDAAAMMSASATSRLRRTTTPPLPTSTLLRAAVELKPEPEGGTELLKMSLSSLPGSRMKNLGPDDNGDGDEDVYKFWLTAIADGAQIKKVRDQTEKEASKKANFPGFRKGQVPPWAQPQITGFAIQEAIIKTCEMSLEAYGLESLPGSAGEVTVNEDIKELCKGYKMGSSVAFTATYRGKFDKALRSSEAMATGVVDVEAVVAEDETSIDVEVAAE